MLLLEVNLSSMAHGAHRSKLASNLNSTPPSSPQIPQNTCEQRRKWHSPNRGVGNQRNKRQWEPNKEDVHRRNKRNRSRNQLLTSDPEDLEVEESPHNREDSDEDWHDEEENQQILPRYRSFQKCQHIVTICAGPKTANENNYPPEHPEKPALAGSGLCSSLLQAI